jgi:hypothetical protein
VIVTEPEIQRQFYDPAMIAWLETQEPVLTINDDGRVYARVFDFSGLPLPEPYYLSSSPIFTWGEAKLVASSFRDEIIPGLDLRVRLFFETQGEPFYYWVEARVIDEQGTEVSTFSKRLRSGDPVPPELRSIFDIPLPDDLPLGTYTVQIGLRDDDSGERLTGKHAITGQETERSVTLGTFSVVQEFSESGQ